MFKSKAGIKVNLRSSMHLVGEMFSAGNFEAGIRAFGNQPDLGLKKAIWQQVPQLCTGTTRRWTRRNLAAIPEDAGLETRCMSCSTSARSPRIQ